MRLPWLDDMPEGIDFAILGVPIDGASTLDGGQRRAPAAIRDASVSRHGYDPVLDVSIFDHLQGIDFGDVPVNPGYIEDSYGSTQFLASEVYAKGAVPLFLGGDHSVTLPELRAAAAEHGPVALVDFDAHYDNNPSYIGKKYNHATWLYHAINEGLIDTEHSIQIGMRGSCGPKDKARSAELGIDVITQPEARKMGIPALQDAIVRCVGERPYFCTFDIDFADPASAPGTATIEQRGFHSSDILELIYGLKDLDLIGMDLVEVLPSKDHAGITSDLASVIIWTFISMMAWRRSRRKEENND